METYNQFPQRVYVWVAMADNCILAPFLLASAWHLHFYIILITPISTYQQDDTPPNFTRMVREYFSQVFANQMSGRRVTIQFKNGSLF